jgi:hypothetical protein
MRLGVGVGLAAAALGLGSCGLADRHRGGQTLGFVLATNDYLMYQTPGAKLECPRGFTPNNRAQWEAQFPTAEARRAHLQRCLATTNRGPNCENVWAEPTLIKDPLPYHAVEGRVSHGVDLDGTDGAATDRTCKHENFVSPTGAKGIDNQYYRFLGCEWFVQGGQLHSPQQAKRRTIEYEVNRILVEVRGVQNQQDDKEVEVTLYRGKDPLMVNAEEDAVPWQSQRIDEKIPPIRLRGRIEGGVLITEPQDVIFEDVLLERRQLIRHMSFRLKLSKDRAEGLRVGYVDLDRFWQSYSRTAKWGGKVYGASGPAAYEALKTLADGDKDPKTGACTSLSSAKKYTFVRAYLVHPDGAAPTREARL